MSVVATILRALGLSAPPPRPPVATPTSYAADAAAVRRWAAARYVGEKAPPCQGKYAPWLRALDWECAERIVLADRRGELAAHLWGYRLITGLPAASLDTDVAKDWLRQWRMLDRRKSIAQEAAVESRRRDKETEGRRGGNRLKAQAAEKSEAEILAEILNDLHAAAAPRPR
jgi:hypothetical protein